jgi:hypothetical protein
MMKSKNESLFFDVGHLNLYIRDTGRVSGGNLTLPSLGTVLDSLPAKKRKMVETSKLCVLKK